MFIVFFAFSILIQLYATEPVCSKFSYEEKLLEKMIRTEIKVETMQNEIKKTEETVLNTLVEIKKTALDIQEQITNKFQELTNNLSREVEKESWNFWAKHKDKNLQPSIAFHVHNVKDLVLDASQGILVFQSIITNEGSGYDKTTGIFTAPLEGVYHFIVHVCSANKKYSPIGLVLDRTFVARSINYDEDTFTCGSVSAIVRMKSGGQVWVASTSGSTLYVLFTHSLHIMNTFSGMFIST